MNIFLKYQQNYSNLHMTTDTALALLLYTINLINSQTINQNIEGQYKNVNS